MLVHEVCPGGGGVKVRTTHTQDCAQGFCSVSGVRGNKVIWLEAIKETWSLKSHVVHLKRKCQAHCTVKDMTLDTWGANNRQTGHKSDNLHHKTWPCLRKQALLWVCFLTWVDQKAMDGSGWRTLSVLRLWMIVWCGIATISKNCQNQCNSCTTLVLLENKIWSDQKQMKRWVWPLKSHEDTISPLIEGRQRQDYWFWAQIVCEVIIHFFLCHARTHEKHFDCQAERGNSSCALSQLPHNQHVTILARERAPLELAPHDLLFARRWTNFFPAKTSRLHGEISEPDT